jgi:hypothetical protein
MKKLLILLALALAPLSLMAQTDPIDELFNKYGEKDGFTTVYINQNLFKLMANVDLNDPEAEQLVKNLTRIRILAQEDSVPGVANFYDEISKNFNFKDFEELMVVKETDQTVKFLVKQVNGKISHLLLIVGGKEDNAVISIEGLIDLNQIAKLAKTMDGPMENLEKLEEKK